VALVASAAFLVPDRDAAASVGGVVYLDRLVCLRRVYLRVYLPPSLSFHLKVPVEINLNNTVHRGMG